MEMRRINYQTLPLGLHGTMQRYIDQRAPAGSFGTAVLSNNLREACATADDFNRHALFEIVSWLYNEAPSACWGSPEKVQQWLANEDGEENNNV